MRAVLGGKFEMAQLISVASFPRNERRIVECCAGDDGRSEEEIMNIAKGV